MFSFRSDDTRFERIRRMFSPSGDSVDSAESSASRYPNDGQESGPAASSGAKRREAFWALKRDVSELKWSSGEDRRRVKALMRKFRHVPVVYCVFSLLQLCVLYGSLWILRPGTTRERDLRGQWCGADATHPGMCWRYHTRLLIPSLTAVLTTVCVLPVALLFDFDLLWGTRPVRPTKANRPKGRSLLEATARPNREPMMTTLAAVVVGAAEGVSDEKGKRNSGCCTKSRRSSQDAVDLRRWVLCRCVLVAIIVGAVLQEFYAYLLPPTIPPSRWTPSLVVTLLPVVFLAIPLCEIARFQVTEGRYGDPWWDLWSLRAVLRGGVGVPQAPSTNRGPREIAASDGRAAESAGADGRALGLAEELSPRSVVISGAEFRRRFRRHLFSFIGGVAACCLPFSFVFIDMGLLRDVALSSASGGASVWIVNCLRILLLVTTRKLTSVMVHRVWIDRDASTVAKMRLVNYLPVMVGAFNGTTTAFFLLFTRHVSGIILYFIVDWLIFFLRVSATSEEGTAVIDGRIGRESGISGGANPRPDGGAADESTVPVESSSVWRRDDLLQSVFGRRPVSVWRNHVVRRIYTRLVDHVRWGRPVAVGGMKQSELHGWILICESLLQTTAFVAFLLLYPVLALAEYVEMGQQEVVDFGWGLYFPTEMSIVWLCVGLVSELVQDWGGHAYVMYVLDCDYTFHLGGKWRELSRFLQAGLIAILYCTVPSVGAQLFVYS